MRVGVVIPTYDQFAHAEIFQRIVRAIEDLGYDSAWFGDHIVLPHEIPDYLDHSWFEALTCAIHGLGMTSRLSFGTDVLVGPYRNPITLAKMATTASHLSSGRLLLGMGIGWLKGEFDALGLPPFADRAKVTEEYLEVMRLLFERDGALSYKGKWVEFEDIHFEPKPLRAPPLLVGGNHANALRRAALLGDGWHPLFMKAEDYAAGRREIERIRAEEGITRPFIYSYSCSQTTLEEKAAPVSAYAENTKQGSSYAPPYPCDATGRPRFKGSAEQLREDCRIFAEAGVEQLVVRFAVTRDQSVDTDSYFHQLERFAHEVLPLCQSFRAPVSVSAN